LAPALICAALPVCPAPAQARAVPHRISALAARSVLAVEGSSQIRTAFAFGSPAAVLASSPLGAATHLLDARGNVADLAVAHREGELVVAHPSGMKLTPLRASTLARTKAGMPAYVLGPPAGYGAGRLRFVRLPPIDLRHARRATLDGQLPQSALGAPVVTEGGRVIGAVATVAHGKWTLEPSARLTDLLAAARASGGGIPILLLLAGALALIVLVLGLLLTRARRRHRRASTMAAARRAGGGERDTQPLVRRREPEGDSPDRGDEHEEFDVVIKSRERS
jgi:hypothetical protein